MELIGILITSFDGISWLPFVSVLSRLLCVPFGGVPKAIVCDNLKAGVVKALWFDPTLNQTFAAMAEHYDMTILPTRSRKPRDKGNVEGAVLIIERWILDRLRHRRADRCQRRTLVERMMRQRPHPEQDYRSAMGIIALAGAKSAIGWKRPVRGHSSSMRSATPR
jgi:hypothetical protein